MINKTHVKNFIFLSSAEGISGFLFFIAMLYAARILGPENLGRATFARSLILYFLMIVTAGLDFLGVREGARDRSGIKNLIEHIVSLRLHLSIITYIILFALLQFFPTDAETRRLVYIYSGMILFSAISIEWYFQALEKMAIPALGRLLSEMVFIVVVFICVKTPDQLLWIPVARIIATAFQNLIYWVTGLRQFRTVRLRWDLEKWTAMLKKSLPMGFGFIMVQVYYYLDSLMLGIIDDYEKVGIYSAAYRILTAIILVLSMLNKTLYPSLSRYFKESVEKMGQLLQDAVQGAFSVTVWIVFHGMILAPWGIQLIYGKDYIQSIPLFQILIFNLLIVVPNGLLAHSVLASNQEKKYLISVSLGALSNFILNLGLIPRFGAYGAAAATIISECVVFIYFYIHCRRVHLDIRVQRFLMIILPGIVAGIPAVYLRLKVSIPAAVIVFNLVYIFCLYKTGWLPFSRLLDRMKETMINRGGDS